MEVVHIRDGVAGQVFKKYYLIFLREKFLGASSYKIFLIFLEIILGKLVLSFLFSWKDLAMEQQMVEQRYLISSLGVV